VFWSVIISMYVGNVILLILNLPLIPYIARILAIPSTVLIPMIMFFSLIGVYFVSFNTFDIYLMVLFAAGAVGLRLLDFPMAPMLLGFILGGMMEENLRRALLIHNDQWSFMWERPLTATILATAILVLFLPVVSGWLGGLMRARRETAGEGG
jgi:putative tricarboxylic transport membrane protein